MNRDSLHDVPVLAQNSSSAVVSEPAGIVGSYNVNWELAGFVVIYQ